MEVEAAILAIEERVGPLPGAYRQFLPDVVGGSTRHFRREDGARSQIYFYRAQAILDDISVSVADPNGGLLVVGNMGPNYYVLEARSGRLYLWDSDVNDFGDGTDRLELVSEDIARFLRDLEPKRPTPPEDPLETLARHAPMARIEMFLDATSDAASLEKVAKWGARAGRIEVVQACLRHSCPTAWLVAFAIRGGHLPMVRYLVEEVGLDPTPALNESVLSTPEVREYLKTRRS